ncbi:hypothetical protein [Nonomuraea sp. NPDC003754]
MGKKFSIRGVEFDLDDITDAHLQRGYSGGHLEVTTADGRSHVFYLDIRDAYDEQAYLILKYESDCYSETRPRSWGRTE